MKMKNILVAAIVGALAVAAAGASAEEINTRIGNIETINGFPTAGKPQR